MKNELSKIRLTLLLYAICLVFCGKLIAATQISQAPRNIYLDLGAFQGDTLQLFKQHGIPLRCHPNVDWEVFAFEACPLLAHSTQLLVDSLNNQSVDPPVLYTDIPGMQELVEEVYRKNLPFSNQLRLFFEKYEALLVSRCSSRGSFADLLLFDKEERKTQLAEARTPPDTSGTKYSLYAMGVGHRDSILKMDWAYSNYINGGGNLLGIDYGRPSHVFHVPVLRLSTWLKESFNKEDYIYVKMDIEGMEFLLLEDLIKTGCLEYINEMDVEWHGRFNVPGREKEHVLRAILNRAGIILRDHY